MKFSILRRFLLSAAIVIGVTGCAGESDTVPVILDGVIDIGTVETSDTPGPEITNDPTTEVTSDPTTEVTSDPTTEVTSDPTTEITSDPTSPPVTNPTGVVTLSWMPPTENTDNSALTDLSGYKIYYGESPESLPNIIVINNIGLTEYVIDNLNTNTTYYFTITAINSSNTQSAYSNIESKYISG